MLHSVTGICFEGKFMKKLGLFAVLFGLSVATLGCEPKDKPAPAPAPAEEAPKAEGATEEPKADEPAAEEPKADEPAPAEPKTEEPAPEEPAPATEEEK